MKDRHRIKRVAVLGVLTAAAVVASWVEFMIPMNIGIQGIKPGLANIATVFALYSLGIAEACIVSLVRIVICGASFGGLSPMLYSLSGAIISIAIMVLLKRMGFSPIATSAAGGAAHNAGQILCAVIITDTPMIATYLPVLLISGTLTGGLVGVVSAIIIKRINLNKENLNE